MHQNILSRWEFLFCLQNDLSSKEWIAEDILLTSMFFAGKTEVLPEFLSLYEHTVPFPINVLFLCGSSAMSGICNGELGLIF